MKGSTFLLLLFAAALFAALAMYQHRSERDRWREQAVPPGSRIHAEFPVNDVAAIMLSGPEGRVTLQRGASGWGVAERTGAPADFELLSALILKISGLEALQSIPVGEADYGVLALRSGEEGTPPEETGTVVELSGGTGQPLAALILGKTHLTTPQGMRPEIGGTATGRYVMPADRGGNAYLVAETFAGLETAPSAWIDKTFIRPGLPRRVEVRSKDSQWVVSREAAGAPWTMEGLGKNQSLDAAKVADIDPMFTGPALADVPDGPEDARAKPLEKNPVSVTADTFDGVRYALTIGRGDGDNLPVQVTAEALPDTAAPDQALAAVAKFKDRVVFVPRNFVAPFLQERAELLRGAGEKR
ncbi:MAG: DUF4340 domain-containing protein [Chthoniobacterales bacterium]